MGSRRLMNRLYYFTIEDESMLAEAFRELDDAVFAITYKVAGTDDVFVTTHETREASMKEALARIDALDAVLEPPRMIRIEMF